MSAVSLTTLKSSALGCEHFSADTFLLLIISLLSYRNLAKRTMTDPSSPHFFVMLKDYLFILKKSTFLKFTAGVLSATQLHLSDKEAE